MRSVPPAALRWPPPPNWHGHGTHVRGARGTQAELVDAGRVLPQDAGGLHAAQAAELLHQPYQIFLEGPALAQVFQTGQRQGRAAVAADLHTLLDRAQSAMRAGLQLLSSFSRSLWMSQPLSLSRAAQAEDGGRGAAVQESAGIGHQPQGQGFAKRALRAQTGRQADIGRQLGRGRGGGLDPVVDRPHAVAAQMMVDIDDGRPGKAAFQSRGQIVA